MKVDKSDLAWLACAIDSEGTVAITSNYAGFTVSNTSEEYLQKVRSILTELGVQFIEHSQDYSNYYPNSKIVTNIQVLRTSSKLILAKAILPFLVIPEKKKNTQLIIERCEGRLKVREQRTKVYNEVLACMNPTATMKELTTKLGNCKYYTDIYTILLTLQKRKFVEKVKKEDKWNHFVWEWKKLKDNITVEEIFERRKNDLEN